jgi:hypothetical protein
MDMNKTAILAMTVAMVVASPILAQQSAMTLGEGDAMLITPSGNMYKSDGKVSGTMHDAAVAQGAEEMPRGVAFYNHGGKLYRVSCVGPSIEGWFQGYPGTKNAC